jgi:hypothetical protein
VLEARKLSAVQIVELNPNLTFQYGLAANQLWSRTGRAHRDARHSRRQILNTGDAARRQDA